MDGGGRVASGTTTENKSGTSPRMGEGRVTHDCMDAGGRTNQGVFVEDAVTEYLSRATVGRSDATFAMCTEK